MDTNNKIDISEIDKELSSLEEIKKELLEKRRRIELFRNYDGQDRVISFKEIKKELEERKEDKFELKTNIPKLDRMTGGFRKGNLIVVSGKTGCGKTSLLQSFLMEFAKQDISTLFFTYEVQPEEFLTKFGDNVPDLAFMPRRHKASKMQWLEERILESIAKYNTKVIMIDHLHFLLDMQMIGRGGNTSLLIGAIMRELKRIAIEYGLIIFIVAHTKKVKFEEDEMPDLDALRDSGMISCEGDFVFIITRELAEDRKSLSNRALLYVAKNRWSGNTGYVELIYSNNQFKELEKNYDE